MSPGSERFGPRVILRRTRTQSSSRSGQVRDNGVQVASLLDVAGCKMAIVQRRAEAKDYRDIVALLENGVDLSRALAAAKAIYGEQFEPGTTLRALSYFADGDLP